MLGYSGLAAPIFQMGFVEGSFGFSFSHSLIEDEKSNSALIERLIEIAHKVTIGQGNENFKNSRKGGS
jgi:hypothetical protein